MRETPAAKTPDRRVPPAEATLQVIVGRWKTLILWHLFQGSAQGGIFSDGALGASLRPAVAAMCKGGETRMRS